MKNPNLSFIILTFNEEQHLPRLLASIDALNANTYVLDSGSTDRTLSICRSYQLTTKQHPFQTHPLQWSVALKIFPIHTPWVIGLDADQVVTPELFRLLKDFKDDHYQNIEGIYFNRLNYFKGKWIRYGGFYPRYMLKMFRYGTGYSDLTEQVDHHFQVPGKTIIWKKGHLIEENLKDNHISFWIEKHNKYSDRLAAAAVLRSHKNQLLIANPFGTPNERIAWLKKLWHQIPTYLRPFLYFGYRMIIQRGFLDGRTGIMYHFLQGFWFRLIVDIKIEEHKKAEKKEHPLPIKFIINFLTLFCLLYGFNLLLIGFSVPGNHYLAFIDQHCNYVKAWRTWTISLTAKALTLLGYSVVTKSTGLTVSGHAGFRLIYTCLGYGIMSFFAAFVLAFPKPGESKFTFLIMGLAGIQLLNILRLMLIAIYYRPGTAFLDLDHHDLFNYSLYMILAISTYFWINAKSTKNIRLKNNK